MRDFNYHDFAYLLEDLGIPFSEENSKYTDSEMQRARDAIQMLDMDKAIVVREWLTGFANTTFVEADESIAKSISKMKDDAAVLHYFSLLFTNFWC